MATISLTLPQSGTVITAGLHSSNYGTLQSTINGGLDNNNFATGKIFDTTKLMQNGATNGQALIWNTGSAQWVPTTPSRFLQHGTKTSSVATSSTTYASGADVLGSALSFTADGTSDYLVSLICAQATTGGGANAMFAAVNLDGSQNSYVLDSTFSNGQPVNNAALLVAPSAGSHTVNVRVWSAGAWTTTVIGGVGGSGVAPPIVVGVEKA